MEAKPPTVERASAESAEPASSPPPDNLLRAGLGLLGSVLEVLSGTGRVAACEARIVARRTMRRASMLGAAVTLAAAGALVTLLGLAWALGAAVGAPWMGFLIVGVPCAAGGVVAARAAWTRLLSTDLDFPATREEIAHDVRALRSAGVLNDGVAA